MIRTVSSTQTVEKVLQNKKMVVIRGDTLLITIFYV